MSADDDASFDPKTWLDPKPKDRPEKTVEDEVKFDPKTWVKLNNIGAATLENARNEAGGAKQGSNKTYVSIALAFTVIICAVGSSVWMLGGADTETDLGVDAIANAAPSDQELPADALAPAEIEPQAPYNGRQQVLSVAGYQGLMQSLLDLGVPAPEANALGRDVVAGLGTEGEEWRIELWVSEQADARAVEFLSARLPDGNGVELTRGPDASFAREDVFSQIRRVVNRAQGQMGVHDFYTVAVNAGIPDSLASDFAKVFSYDFSFADEVKSGDQFEAMWETQVDERGDEVSPPRLLYARMVTVKGEREYFAFTPPGAIEAQWFSPQGLANVRSLLRTPVDGARISSKFGFRNHPIRQRRIKHGGVDFAAPTGTPVYASGDSTVQVKRFSRSAGNMVVLDHGDGMVTRYFHLNTFADGLENGKSVKQGETIGFVGSTGASTGPHLHYEIIVDGEKLDPLTFDTSTVEPLTGDGLTMFGQHRKRLQSELD